MQYIAGDDLSNAGVQERPPSRRRKCCLWADQLCDALDYLHTQDHRSSIAILSRRI